MAQSPSTVTATAGAAATPVTLTFTSSDTNPITSLSVTSGLTTLPAGWTGPTTFSCASVTSGTGCVLTLQFAPTAAATGTISIGYSYTNNQSTAKTGTASIAYTATAATGPAANTVNGTAVPPSPIVVALNGTQAIPVTFTTSDGMPATAFSITSGLSSLPAGWTSSASTLTCASVSAGNSCQVTLTFAPTAVAAGTVTLAYAYTDHAGTAKTGSIALAYSVSSNNNVNYVATPGGTVSVAPNGTPQAVVVKFNTDDANAATVLSLDLSTLPAGWTATPATTPFTCATVANTGTGCQITLTYAPTVAGNGSLSLPYTYTSNSGVAGKSGHVTIAYQSLGTAHAYIANGGASFVYCTVDNTSGALTGCATTGGSAINNANGVALDGVGDAYIGVPSAGTNSVKVCDVNSDGSLGNCGGSGPTFTTPNALEILSGGLYAAQTSRTIRVCDLASDGTVSGCGDNTAIPAAAAIYGMALAPGVGYFADKSGSHIYLCDIDSSGVISGCQATGANISQPIDVKVVGSFAYIANNLSQSVTSCSVNGDGTLTGCTAYPTVIASPRYIAIYNGRAYVTGRTGSVDICPVNTSTGVISTCSSQTDGTFNQTQQIKIQ